MSKPDEAGSMKGPPPIKSLRTLASKSAEPAPPAIASAIARDVERLLDHDHYEHVREAAPVALLVVGPDRRRAVCFTTRPRCLRKELLREGVYTLGVLPPELWKVAAPRDARALSS